MMIITKFGRYMDSHMPYSASSIVPATTKSSVNISQPKQSMLDKNGLFSSVKPATTGWMNHGPNLWHLSYMSPIEKKHTVAQTTYLRPMNWAFLLSFHVLISFCTCWGEISIYRIYDAELLERNLNSYFWDTVWTSVAKPANPRKTRSFMRNTFWKFISTVWACIPKRVSLHTSN